MLICALGSLVSAVAVSVLAAMIADKPMLILDEVTSSVDTRTELYNSQFKQA